MQKGMHIHFMGIGGSGISGVAILAKKQGFKVSGCDLEKETAYLANVKDKIKEVFQGHNKKHIKEADLVVASPSVLYQSGDHPELLEAKKRKIVMTWEEFLGKYLHKGKNVICISGTHGKSTTTALTGLIFEKAQLKPSVLLGAKVKEWNSNVLAGSGKYFITEADEFYNNFLNYSPEAVILNNIEFDHPDFFENESSLILSFSLFVKRLVGRRILIVNQDSYGIRKLFNTLPEAFLSKTKIYGYSFLDEPLLDIWKSTKIKIINKTKTITKFSVKSDFLNLNSLYYLSIPGEFNVANATGVIILSKLYGIKDKVIGNVLKKFKGIGRRLELIGEKKGILVYDDYAHHPTAIAATLSALRQKYPKERIWVVVEPHSYSRTKALLKTYKGVFGSANKVIIGPIFKARDREKFGISGYSIVKISDHKDIRFIPSPEMIVSKIKKERKEGDVIIVMGAGYSYKWSKEILHSL